LHVVLQARLILFCVMLLCNSYKPHKNINEGFIVFFQWDSSHDLGLLPPTENLYETVEEDLYATAADSVV
jgi:hypothetical protein